MLSINTVFEQVPKQLLKIFEALDNDFKNFKEDIENVYNDLQNFHKYYHDDFKKCEDDYKEKINNKQDSEVTIEKLADKIFRDIFVWREDSSIPRPTEINEKLNKLKNKKYLIPIKPELLDKFIISVNEYLDIPIFLTKESEQNKTESRILEIINNDYINYINRGLFGRLFAKNKYYKYPSVIALKNLQSQISKQKEEIYQNHNSLKTEISNNLLNYIIRIIKKYPRITLILLGLLLAVCGFIIYEISACVMEPKLPEGTYNYGGSTTWRAIHHEIDERIQKKFPKVHLNYDKHMSEIGSHSGINQILKGYTNLAFVEISRAPTQEEKKQLKDNNLIPIPIAEDGIAIAVNPKLQISGLTVSQIKDIYTDKITNWHQINNQLPDLPIKAYSRDPKASGTAFFFQDKILENENFGNVKFKDTTTHALEDVTNNLEGIYYASASEIVPQCKVKALEIIQDKPISLYNKKPPVFGPQCTSNSNHVNTELLKTPEYPLQRKIYIIIKKYGKDNEFGRDFVNWLRGKEGRELIEKAGFAPLESNPLPKEIPDSYGE